MELLIAASVFAIESMVAAECSVRSRKSNGVEGKVHAYGFGGPGKNNPCRLVRLRVSNP
jgi:hypothetical protein